MVPVDGGQGLPDVGQGLPDVGQGLPDVGQGLPDVGQGLPDVGQGLPDGGRAAAGDIQELLIPERGNPVGGVVGKGHGFSVAGPPSGAGWPVGGIGGRSIGRNRTRSG